jgi:hypothetical protein
MTQSLSTQHTEPLPVWSPFRVVTNCSAITPLKALCSCGQKLYTPEYKMQQIASFYLQRFD